MLKVKQYINITNIISVLLGALIYFIIQSYSVNKEQPVVPVESNRSICVTLDNHTNCSGEGRMLEGKDLQPAGNPQSTLKRQET